MELWPGGPLELPHQITLDGHVIEFPEIPTHRLLGWLSQGMWWELFPNAVDVESFAPFMLRFLDDDDLDIDFEHMWVPAITVFAGLAGTAPREGGGIGWWPALRLAASAVVQWQHFSAWCATRNLDPLGGPLWRTIAAVYAWLRELTPPEDLPKLENQIWGPPPGSMSVREEQPRHVRDQEAALALAALRETMPGEDRVGEWSGG